MQDQTRIEQLKQERMLYTTSNPIEIEYLLGKVFSKATLIVGRGKAALFVDGRYRGACHDLIGVTIHNDTEQEKKNYFISFNPLSVSYDPLSISLVQFREIQRYRLEERPIVREMRQIKDEKELEKLRESAKLNWLAFQYLMTKLQVGITETQAAWIFEKYAREHGAEAMAFAPKVAFGPSSAIPHYRTGKIQLKEGMPVLIDVGVVKDRYVSDMSRSFLFRGEDPEYQKCHDLVVAVQKEACAMAKPGVPVAFIDKHVRTRFEEAGFSDGIKHATGHGVGLEIHEAPRISIQTPESVQLREGMVITIEPGLYFDQKWGIRHEDTLIIHKEEPENLYDEDGHRSR